MKRFSPSSPDIPFNSIYGYLSQDAFGRLWMGTDQGIFTYDGKQFQSIPISKKLKGREILGLTKLKSGYLLAVTLSGQICYMREDSDSLMQFDPGPAFEEYTFRMIDLTQDSIMMYAMPNDKEGRHKIYKIDLSQMSLSLFKDIGVVKKVSARGSIPSLNIVGGELIYRSDKQKFRKWKDLDESNEIGWRKGRPIYHAGDKYFYTLLEVVGDSLISLTPKTMATQRFKNKYLTTTGEAITSHDESIIVTAVNGCFRMDKNFNMLPVGGKDVFLSNTPLQNLYEDKERNLWIGSLQKGLFFIPRLSTIHISKDNSSLPSNELTHLFGLGNRQIISCSRQGQISLIDEYDIKNSIQIPNCHRLLEASFDGEYLVVFYIYLRPQLGFSSRLAYVKVDPSQDQLTVSHLKKYPVQSWAKGMTYSPKENNHYIGSNKGMSRFASETKSRNETAKIERPIVNERISSLHMDQFQNRIWLSLPYDLVYYDLDKEQIVKPSFKGHKFNAQPQSIQQTSDSTIWVVTNNDGLFGIKNDSIYVHLTTKDGLSSNNGSCLYANDQPYLWIGTPKGINRLDIRNGKLIKINGSDGLLNENIVRILQQDSMIYAATPGGLFLLEESEITTPIPPPGIHIDQVKIWNRDTSVNGQDLLLSHQQNNLEFHFSSVSFKSENRLRYLHRMIGIDSAWTSAPPSVQQARFPQMSPGSYRFEVKAVNADGIESTQAASLNINISAPYWRRAWFISLLIALIALLSGGVAYGISKYRSRIRQREDRLLLQIQQLREEALRAQMNPHFIFNSLNAILLFLARNDQKSAILFLSKFSRLIRYIFEYSHKDEIAISEELEFLSIYLSLEGLRFRDKVDIHLDVDDSLVNSSAQIPPLLIQPVIENSFKHGLFHKKDKGELKVRIRDLEDAVQVAIEDNGIGRTKSREINKRKRIKRTTSSERVIRERIQLLNEQSNLPNKIQMQMEDLTDAEGHERGLRTIFTFKIH
ncbi:MAG: histidine kinase [Bacteroidota bacterium]